MFGNGMFAFREYAYEDGWVSGLCSGVAK
ncbi:hypothetical protein AGR4C_Lc130077 [Agrobacterium tumefaciens str. Kerr 14]|uniref:Uncharacterized protein n=2 Tax=Agrobacterium TaxID=357 RepID=A0A1S7TSA8_9HYPH|nr:hypothetical protein AGR4B_Lc10189 [Agrobacterium tumefaciens str. CFBP 5621]CUX41309.1 hypothetical protein AGR7B_Lc170083 [Agrobacterium deltaense RV3]CUX50600.1 hypothetical protein AGR4C_Lc130077 [Agrobacterium tumefaciens str. Kerr 14]CVI57488.1 hypothetical protein AGR7A_Lc10183 [Agrobacterium deltaense NCPPB 1641]CVI62387.1 hypothetical protein AGR9A_Lc20015 [Agrobacterium salinitolerans str. Hayward 0363]